MAAAGAEGENVAEGGNARGGSGVMVLDLSGREERVLDAAAVARGLAAEVSAGGGLRSRVLARGIA